MNEAPPPAHTPTRGERRAEAREKARVLRESQRKKERRTLWIVQGSIAVVVVAIIAVVALVLTNSVRPEGDGPLNMASDGIKIGQNFEAVATPSRPAGARPIPSEPNPAGVVEIQVFVDYLCPRCAEFDAENGEMLASQSVPHETRFPAPGYAEQSPDDWWRGMGEACRGVVAGADCDVVGVCLAATSRGGRAETSG